MPKGLQGFQKGHKGFIPKEKYKEIGEKVSRAKKGRKLSEEHKKHMSEANIGKPHPWMVGDKNPAKRLDIRKKMSERMTGSIGNMLGKHHTEETKRKISEGNKGKIASLETRQKIGLAHRGKKYKLWTEESRKRASIAKLKKPTRYWLGKKRLDRMGENSNFWKGGITLLNKQIRTCFEYRQWRSDVFMRDNYTCQECGMDKCWIEAHHIKELSKILFENKITTLEQALNCEELWNINNGRTLCMKCHNKNKKRN